MAEILVKFDTKTKEMTITKDGEAVDNVMMVSLSKKGSYYGDMESESEDMTKYCCCITTMDKYSEDGYSEYSQLMASADGGFTKRALQSPLIKSISNYLSAFSRSR